MYEFAGKTALVTGASRGIGEETVRRLDSLGARVALIARGLEDLNVIAADLQHDPVVVRANLASEVEVYQAADTVLSAVAELDILVNNAGMGWAEAPDAITPNRLDLQLNLNIRNVMILTGVLLPSLIKRRGAIVNVSSIAAEGGDGQPAVYAATKGALNSYTRNLARSLGSTGLRVNAVAPGLIETKIWQPVFEKGGGRETVVKARAQQIPMARWGTPYEVAAAICFLCSSEASYITGQVLRVDGGFVN